MFSNSTNYYQHQIIPEDCFEMISNVHEISSYGVAIKDFKSSHTLVCCGLKFLCAL